MSIFAALYCWYDQNQAQLHEAWFASSTHVVNVCRDYVFTITEHHCPEVSRLNLSACIWTETVPFFWSENTRMVSSTYMTEKNPVPEIGRGILRPHAVIWPPLMFAFTNLGKLVLLSCIHSTLLYIHTCAEQTTDFMGSSRRLGTALTPSSLLDGWNDVKTNTHTVHAILTLPQ